MDKDHEESFRKQRYMTHFYLSIVFPNNLNNSCFYAIFLRILRETKLLSQSNEEKPTSKNAHD